MESYYRDSPVRPLKSPGVKSPGRVSRDAFKGNRPVRSDFSRARARAIEASLDLGEPWLPSTNPRVKTPEEEVFPTLLLIFMKDYAIQRCQLRILLSEL